MASEFGEAPLNVGQLIEDFGKHGRPFLACFSYASSRLPRGSGRRLVNVEI
jgi:hypothetical protein